MVKIVIIGINIRKISRKFIRLIIDMILIINLMVMFCDNISFYIVMEEMVISVVIIFVVVIVKNLFSISL